MLDPKVIRENPNKVKQNILERGLSGPQFDVDGFLRVDEKRKIVNQELEALRSVRNKLSDTVGKPSEEVITKVRETKESIKALEEALKELNAKWTWYMDWFPNMADPSAPVGKNETSNKEVKAWSPGSGYFKEAQLGNKDFSEKWMPRHQFHTKDHLELGESLDIIDIKQSALVSGSRFVYLKKEAALLQYALFEHLQQKLLSEGFTPMVVPLMVKRRALHSSSHFPGDEDQVYKIAKNGIEDSEDMFLVGSSEPSLFAYYMDKTLQPNALPQKFFAFTPCFRTEVGSWGKDVRGIKRVHQFDKLEMDLLCAPEDSEKLHDYLLSINEWFLQSLGLPYHILLMCTGDLGYFAAAKKYDFEAWLPHQNEFIELGSDTNAKDYQARRYNTKFKDQAGNLHYVHTVNDTGCAIGRTLVAILENYQQADGSVVIPKALVPYMHGIEIISPNS